MFAICFQKSIDSPNFYILISLHAGMHTLSFPALD